MAANSRFAVATHLMTSLALLGRSSGSSALATSDELAASVNTSPIVVRRILGLLREAGLVLGHPGRSGGTTLAKPETRITLLDIHRAVDEPMLFAFNKNRPNPRCPVSCRMKEILGPVFDDAERAVEERLRRVRLSELVDGLIRPATP